MTAVIRLLRNRNVLLSAAVALGLLWEGAASPAEPLIFPALALIMTVAVTGIGRDAFESPRLLFTQGAAGVVMNYLVHGTFLLALSSLLIRDDPLWRGFVLLAAVPPAVAVVPFAVFLGGNIRVALLGTVGAYLGGLVIAPVIAWIFIGETVLSPVKILVVIAELIVMPVVLARILVRTGIARTITPIRGDITNGSFFLITYTIVGLNRQVFLTQPLVLLPVAIISLSSTFLLGWLIEIAARKMRMAPDRVTSVVLLGTLKNYGLSGGLALSFLDQRAAIPSTVAVVSMIVYIIWLDFRQRRVDAEGKGDRGRIHE